MNTQELCKKWGIAITGNIATGKSFTCNILQEMNYHVIDADKLSHMALEKKTDEYLKVVEYFGQEVLDKDENISRKVLSQKVFANEEKRSFLESIVHPALEKILSAELEKLNLYQKPKIWFYEAALIIEKKKHSLFREVWLTHCTNVTQMERLKNRKNDYTDLEIKNILSSQLSFIHKRKFCHFEINTDFSEEITTNSIKDRLKNIALE